MAVTRWSRCSWPPSVRSRFWFTTRRWPSQRPEPRSRSGVTPAEAHRLLATGRLDELEVQRGDYVRAVLWDTGGRINEIRSQLAYALDALLARTVAPLALDAKTHGDLRERFRQSLDWAASSALLTEAFDDAVNVLAKITESPTEGRLELKLARAARFIEEHHAQGITLAGVARHSGLSIPTSASVSRNGTAPASTTMYAARASNGPSDLAQLVASGSDHQPGMRIGSVSHSTGHFGRSWAPYSPTEKGSACSIRTLAKRKPKTCLVRKQAARHSG